MVYNKTIYSKNNRICIGPVYPPNKWILHPIAMKLVKDSTYFCPVEPYKINNTIYYLDECDKKYLPQKSIDINKDYIKNFNYKHFLKRYYKIESFEGLCKYNLDNAIYFETLNRLLNCAWNGFKINYIPIELVELYINIIKKYWIKEYFSIFLENIEVIDNRIKFVDYTNQAIDIKKIERINFMIEKLVTYKNIKNILEKYNSKIKNDKEYKEHNILLKKYIVNYFRDIIKNNI